MRRYVILAILLLIATGATHAAVYVDCAATDAVHNGTSWQTAYTTIGQALNAVGNGGEIWVKTGTYRERLALNTYTTIYGGFLGFETSTEQRLSGAFPTVITAGRTGGVITMPDSAHVILDGLTIRDGKSDRGAGIRCATDATVNISNCRILSCEATVRGGGVLYDTYALGTMDNCLVEYNIAPDGGGLVVEYHSYPTMSNNVIVRNHATEYGGGVYCPFHSGANLANCTIAYNQADSNGGGIYAYYGGPETFKSCIIAYNIALAGAGLYADGGTSSATLSGCDWYGNSNGDLGGYLSVLPGGNITSNPMFLMPEEDEFHLTTDSLCAGIGAYPLASPYPLARIGVAKLLSDGTSVSLSNKVVSCIDGSVVYVEEPDRGSAIAVRGLAGCSPGTILASLVGTMTTEGSSRVLSATSYCISGATCDLRPIAAQMAGLRSLGGEYVLTWGIVSALTSDGFSLTDNLLCEHVRWTGAPPQLGSHVVVTGAATLDGSFLARTVRAASAP